MKRRNALHIIPTLSLLTLCFAAPAQAQTPPPAPAAPTAEPVAPPPAAKAVPRAPQASSQVTVTRRAGCVTVKVCPGPGANCPAQAAPAAPAPPPAAPRATRNAPPKVVCVPLSEYRRQLAARTAKAPQAKKRKPLTDPANTRLAVNNTAEVLGHLEWEVAFKQLAGLWELSLGLGDRFQISFKTSPVTWFLPDMKLRHALWAGEVRAQIVRTRLFKLTADATYFHISEFHGLKLGMSAKYGNDRLAVHAGIGTVMLFIEGMQADTCGGPVAEDGASYSDCGGGSTGPVTPLTLVTANVGLEARFWRYGKFFLEAFMANMPQAGPEATFWALVPGVRFHGRGFAADLGLGVMGFGEIKAPAPVVNLSYRW